VFDGENQVEKTAYVVLTKDEVINVLRDEPTFMFGTQVWATPSSDGGTICKTCAVGALVHRLIVAEESAQDVRRLCFASTREDHYLPDGPDFREQALGLMNSGSYFASISVMYEGLCGDRGVASWQQPDLDEMDEVIDQLLGFVQSHLPEKIEVRVHGYEDAVRESRRVVMR
jgi:hypothetical protein